jgi:hypothetical protein
VLPGLLKLQELVNEKFFVTKNIDDSLATKDATLNEFYALHTFSTIARKNVCSLRNKD